MSRSREIDGVTVRPLKLLPNSSGRLMEIVRDDEPDHLGFAQAYVTSTFPGVVKAWYRHRRQIDQIVSVTGLVKLVLFDSREGSPSRDVVQEIHLGDLAPRLVRIPPGVWHGFKSVGLQEAFLLHLNSVAFDPADPDEERLDPGDPRVPYEW